MSDPPQEGNHLQKLKGAASLGSRNKPGEFDFEGSAIFWDGPSNTTCKAHGGGRICVEDEDSGCGESVEGKPPLFKARGRVAKRCQHAGCMKSVHSVSQGESPLCKAHGGGQRCLHEPGCTKSAHKNTTLCKIHGGATRCSQTGCNHESARGGTGLCRGLCRAHGGGRRCVFESCGNSVRGSASLCTLHKGGKRCEANGCGKSAQGVTTFCKSHEGAATTAIGVNVPNNWTNSCPIVNALIDAQCTQMEADNKAHNAQMLAEQRASTQHNPQLLTAHHAEYAEAYMQQQQYYNVQEASSSADAPGGRNGGALSLQTPNLRSWLLSPLNGEYSPLTGRVVFFYGSSSSSTRL